MQQRKTFELYGCLLDLGNLLGLHSLMINIIFGTLINFVHVDIFGGVLLLVRILDWFLALLDLVCAGGQLPTRMKALLEPLSCLVHFVTLLLVGARALAVSLSHSKEQISIGVLNDLIPV